MAILLRLNAIEEQITQVFSAMIQVAFYVLAIVPTDPIGFGLLITCINVGFGGHVCVLVKAAQRIDTDIRDTTSVLVSAVPPPAAVPGASKPSNAASNMVADVVPRGRAQLMDSANQPNGSTKQSLTSLSSGFSFWIIVVGSLSLSAAFVAAFWANRLFGLRGTSMATTNAFGDTVGLVLMRIGVSASVALREVLTFIDKSAAIQKGLEQDKVRSIQ